MNINLYHKHYDEQHLAEVKAEMLKRGAPVIRCIKSEVYGEWMAIEGCHRIRAAAALGLTPIIKDVTGQITVSMQIDGESIRVKVADLAAELEDGLWQAYAITFEE